MLDKRYDGTSPKKQKNLEVFYYSMLPWYLVTRQEVFDEPADLSEEVEVHTAYQPVDRSAEAVNPANFEKVADVFFCKLLQEFFEPLLKSSFV